MAFASKKLSDENFSQNEAPDKASKKGKSEAARVNTQRARDTETAGAKGSNHIGQGSAGDSTHAASPQKNPIRKGNSAESEFDRNEDQEMDMDLGTGSKAAN